MPFSGRQASQPCPSPGWQEKDQCAGVRFGSAEMHGHWNMQPSVDHCCLAIHGKFAASLLGYNIGVHQPKYTPPDANDELCSIRDVSANFRLGSQHSFTIDSMQLLRHLHFSFVQLEDNTQARFSDSFGTILRAHMDSLKKREKTKSKPAAKK